MKLKHKIDYNGLFDYLSNIKYSEIETTWDKPTDAKLVEAHCMDDIEYFSIDKTKLLSNTIIDYGMPFLVDVLGNDLSIVILSRRKYKLPNGRVVQAKYVTTIIDDCRKVFGTPLNGYWTIPTQFIKAI